jgi:hypothetical protein
LTHGELQNFGTCFKGLDERPGDLGFAVSPLSVALERPLQFLLLRKRQGFLARFEPVTDERPTVDKDLDDNAHGQQPGDAIDPPPLVPCGPQCG